MHSCWCSRCPLFHLCSDRVEFVPLAALLGEVFNVDCISESLMFIYEAGSRQEEVLKEPRCSAQTSGSVGPFGLHRFRPSAVPAGILLRYFSDLFSILLLRFDLFCLVLI